jgi:hypothetical protein
MSASEPDPAETPQDVDPRVEPSSEEESQDPQPESARAADPEPVRRTGSVGPLLCLGAAVLTVLGSFLELLVVENLPSPNPQDPITFTSWTADLGGDTGGTQPVPLDGVPLMAAAAILLVAAMLWLLRTGPLARARNLVPAVAGFGAAFLAGAVAMIGMQVLWWMELFAPPAFAPASDITTTAGPGFWMLVVGVALAVGAAVLSWRQRRPETEPVEPVEPAAADTPAAAPAGEPVVSVRRLPDAPPDDPPPAAQGS